MSSTPVTSLAGSPNTVKFTEDQLVVSIRWKEPSLIITNAVMALAAVVGFAYSFFK